jgi:hypothetical protein
MSLPPNPTTEDTEQSILNQSWDKTFDVLVAEALGYDGADLIRLKVDSDGVVQIA